MREHGVLRRALLVYIESVPKIRANPGTFPADALTRSSSVRTRPRRPAGRSDVQPDCHRQIERCRSANLAGRRPGPDRRASGPQDRRTPAVELAAAFDASKSGGVIVAAISAVFTIGYVANILGEDEDWLHDLSVDMFPEDGCLRVYGVGEDGVTAFTEYGIECLRQIIADQRAAGNAPPEVIQRNSLPLRCSPHTYPAPPE
jgi:hypothetical protein